MPCALAAESRFLAPQGEGLYEVKSTEYTSLREGEARTAFLCSNELRNWQGQNRRKCPNELRHYPRPEV